MKKLTSAALLLIGTLGVSAAGQVKSGATANNHPNSIAAGAPVGSEDTPVKLLARSANSGNEKIASGLPSELTSKADFSETSNAPFRRIALAWGNAPVNTPVPSLLADRDSTLTSSDSAKPAVTSVAITAALTQVYRVGVGDVLDVQLQQSSSSKSTLFTVLEGGVLDYPLLSNPIPVAGLTAAEVAALLSQQIKIFEKPMVVVDVRDYASHKVTVSGLVGAPGIKPLRREAVPLYVIISQSLPLAEAARATIIRPRAQPMTVDLSDSTASSTLVIPGDIIKVSPLPAGPTEFFFAGGEINVPGQKPYHAGLTLTQAILASGGLSKNASTKVRVSRQAADGRLVRTEYNLRNIQSGRAPDPVLHKGDRVEVSVQ